MEPHNSAVLSKAKVSVVRSCANRFPSRPTAHRHFTALAEEVPNRSLNPLGTFTRAPLRSR